MDFDTLYNDVAKEFGLEGLSKEKGGEILLEIAKTIQKQFLLDVYDILGDEKFAALQASVDMGEEFYQTTLKHVLPNYEEVFKASKQKIVDAFNTELPEEKPTVVE
jgi:hypothetical protein